MERDELICWMRSKYPTTIIRDRYDGTYNFAQWIAFPLRHDDLPSEVIGSDEVACDFLDTFPVPHGLGDTPDQAFQSLIQNIKALI